MIKCKKDLIKFLTYEKKIYIPSSLKQRIIMIICHENRYIIWKYVKYLRMTEYYYNMNKSIRRNIMYLLYRRKKNKLGIKLGLEIWENTFDIGLNIWHSGNIVVNGEAKIGKNCLLRGDNCIGKIYNGKSPIIGDNVDIGVGAKIIGDIQIGNNVIIGAQSVVNKSFSDDVVIAGVPAKIIK